MMGPYGKGAGKSGLICFANAVSLDFFFNRILDVIQTKHLQHETIYFETRWNTCSAFLVQ